ncbi:MAG: hypothetical protein JJ913_03085 [Rhizobiaceae bacterium]|nr:hypothetical protein [Rhizobiaceae bacterium]
MLARIGGRALLARAGEQHNAPEGLHAETINRASTLAAIDATNRAAGVDIH